MRKIRAGEAAVPPATLVISQSELQPWVRGVVWDTCDAGDCAPMEPSTRDGAVGGKASIDRAAVRAAHGAAAEELAGTHRDLIGQVGEGARSAVGVSQWYVI